MSSAARLARLVPALLVVLSVALVYAQTAGHGFVDYDTSFYLTSNPHVLRGLSLENVRWAFTSLEMANWHPLTWLSHMLDVELFGLWPGGHHLMGAAWHAANALLVWALFRRLGLGAGVALFGALVFAVHPLRAESVAWEVERKDLLSACFGLACLLVWLDWRRNPRTWKLVGAFVLYACSLMSKPMLVTLPGLCVLLECWPLGRTSWRPRQSDLALLGFLLMALVSSRVTLLAQSGSGAVQGFETWPLLLRVENALDACVWYLTHTFVPRGLAFQYPLAPHAPRWGTMLADAGLLLAISAACWALRARLPALLCGWLWFLASLLPVIGLVQVGGQAHADRYTYLPTLGLLFGVGSVLERELLPRLGARAAAALGCAAVLGLGLAGWRQVGTWKSSETMARHALEVTRDNNVALDVLGSFYTNANRQAEALPLLREAVRIAPNDPDAAANLGRTLIGLSEFEESEHWLKHACRLTPWRAQNWSLLGGLYFTQRRYPQALEALDRAVELDPSYIGAWLNRGLVLEALGRLDEARVSLENATRLRPEDWNAQLTLGRVLLHLERAEEARARFRAVIEHEPDNFEAWRGLERVELARRALTEAWRCTDEALRLRPGNAAVLADRAWILAYATQAPLARPSEALELARRALEIAGEQPALLDAFALACAANGDFARATAAAEKAQAQVRAVDAAWAERLERRLAAYRAGRVDRETPR